MEHIIVENNIKNAIRLKLRLCELGNKKLNESNDKNINRKKKQTTTKIKIPNNIVFTKFLTGVLFAETMCTTAEPKLKPSIKLKNEAEFINIAKSPLPIGPSMRDVIIDEPKPVITPTI